MLSINEKSHISTVIGSLDKIYKQAKLTGQLNSVDIFYLNIIYKLITGCNVSLNEKQMSCLISLYSRISFSSTYICPVKPMKKYQLTKRNTFIQAETTDCNTYTHSDKIFYWQEEDYNSIISFIEASVDDSGYLTNKLFDTYSNFQIGKDIEYSNIGRICFLAMESETLNFEVRDIDNNIITDAFDVVLIPIIKATLFVSKNIISHGSINFKIKKLA